MKTYPKVKRVEGDGTSTAEDRKAEEEEEAKSDLMVAQVFEEQPADATAH